MPETMRPMNLDVDALADRLARGSLSEDEAADVWRQLQAA